MALTPNRKRVLCLEESLWVESRGLASRTSTLPILELLQRMGAIEEFVHRHVLGFTEFENYLSRRTPGRARTRTYGVLYIAFHGSRDGVLIGERCVPLEELADLIGPFPGGIVHLSSCSVLQGDKDAARRFLAKTGARMISGYESDVVWLDSAALDTAWLGYLAWYERPGDAERYFRERFASLAGYLKWDVVAARG